MDDHSDNARMSKPIHSAFLFFPELALPVKREQDFLPVGGMLSSGVSISGDIFFFSLFFSCFQEKTAFSQESINPGYATINFQAVRQGLHKFLQEQERPFLNAFFYIRSSGINCRSISLGITTEMNSQKEYYCHQRIYGQQQHIRFSSSKTAFK